MQRFWIWPIALYLFLGGLGGGMMFFAFIVGVVLFPSAVTSATLVWGVLVAFLCLGVGTGLLIFELGQPQVFYRAFVTKTSVIKWGAVFLSISMVFGVIFIIWELEFLGILPFIPEEGIARFCLTLAGCSGVCVTVYTGVLLSSMKSRPFWNTPALPLLFAVSALSTGAALLGCCVGDWPFPEGWLFYAMSSSEVSEHSEELIEYLHSADRILILVEMAVLGLFVMLQFCASNVTAKKVAERWVRGEWAGLFWGVMVFCGLVVPFVLNCMGGIAGSVFSPLIALGGGTLLRFMIVWSNDRMLEPGEEKYFQRLPQASIDILHYWDPGTKYWQELPSSQAATHH